MFGKQGLAFKSFENFFQRKIKSLSIWVLKLLLTSIHTQAALF